MASAVLFPSSSIVCQTLSQLHHQQHDPFQIVQNFIFLAFYILLDSPFFYVVCKVLSSLLSLPLKPLLSSKGHLSSVIDLG
ncbi:hypothetical protein CEXT_316371 [Caerostris extrusa]|uniref:Uncharacterized protein n=1 Tax=Caerostris extrusa TaxID=172846 RepID=A0AAV4VLX6_CAEEX|nr:hypothetical protein CEXT_316371 [Caerostris extrusa]